MFIPTAELVIPTGTQTNEEDDDVETQPAIAEASISKFSTNLNLNTYISSHTFHFSLNHYILLHLKDNSLFYQFFLI